MQFELALNVVWLALGLCALAGAARQAWKTSGRVGSKTPAWLHIVGVALIVAALFPYISATDDIVRVEQFSSEHAPQQHHPTKQDNAKNLVRLYETLDSPVLWAACELLLTLFVIWLICSPVVIVSDRKVPFVAGRSPPLAA